MLSSPALAGAVEPELWDLRVETSVSSAAPTGALLTLHLHVFTNVWASPPPPQKHIPTLLEGSLDRTVRLWDLREGMPVSVSRPHGGTVRAVALDDACLFSGGSDHIIRLWEASGGSSSSNGSSMDIDVDRLDRGADGEDLLLLTEEGEGGGIGGGAAAGVVRGDGGRGGVGDELLFDLTGQEQLLTGHIGPITSLSLAKAALYSASWDTSVRVWQRSEE